MQLNCPWHKRPVKVCTTIVADSTIYGKYLSKSNGIWLNVIKYFYWETIWTKIDITIRLSSLNSLGTKFLYSRYKIMQGLVTYNWTYSIAPFRIAPSCLHIVTDSWCMCCRHSRNYTCQYLVFHLWWPTSIRVKFVNNVKQKKNKKPC